MTLKPVDMRTSGLRGVEWKDLCDGRVRCLRRGVHYSGPPDAVRYEANVMAERLGKHATTLKEQKGESEAVWVQFLDGRLHAGEPCSRCGGLTLYRVQKFFARCGDCHAIHELLDTGTDVPPASHVVEFVDVRALGPAGQGVGSVSVLDASTLVARFRFFRSVAAANVTFDFESRAKSVLRSGSPHVVAVPGPQVVSFALKLDSRVLAAGTYAVRPSLRVLVAQDQRDPLEIAPFRSLALLVVDPEASADGQSEPDPLRLQWSFASAPGDPSPHPLPDTPTGLLGS